MNKFIAKLLFLVSLVSVSGWTAAAVGVAGGEALSGEVSGGDFLPVEQAYQLAPEIQGDELVLNWQIADGYYLYGKRFKLNRVDREQGAKLALRIPQGKLKHDEYFGEMEVFYHQVATRSPLPSQQPFTVKVSSQGCADAGLCYPPNHRWYSIDPVSGVVTRLSDNPGVSPAPAVSLDVPPVEPAVAATPSTASEAEPLQSSLLLMAAMAFVGGLILNLMPCVFPVLALKAISLLESTDINPAERRMHGLVYTAGAVSSFMFVAGVLMLLRASGQELGWGYQLQSPWFVAALVYLFFLMGLSFSGAIELGSGLAGVGQGLVEKGGMTGSFFTGVLAVVVASPCTAPFMGASLGFALTQPMPVALTVFFALGMGMAAPFLLLSIIPGLGRLLPRPGNWMVTLKEVLAFPMYLTGIWLLWVLGRQAGIDAAMLVLIGCLLIAIALYFWKKLHWHHRGVAVAAIIGATAILGSGILQPIEVASAQVAETGFPVTKEGDALAYSPDRLAALQRDGGPIFLDVTADWCITCKANERVALDTDVVKAAMAERHIRYMVADWTRRDAEVSRLLAQYNRSGVPLYVYFPGEGKPAVVLPQLLSKEKVLAAFNSPQAGNADQGS